jgi:hypothetical protein
MRVAAPRREGLGRAQRLALIGGAVQVLAVLLHLVPLPPSAALLQVVSGVIGLYSAGSHYTARLYGTALAVVYGELMMADLDSGPLALAKFATLHDGRMVVLGLVIAMVPRHTGRAEGS